MRLVDTNSDGAQMEHGILSYHHLSLSVTDLPRSTDWYRTVLALDVVAQIEGPGFNRNRLRAPGSGVTLTLTCHERSTNENFSELRTGLDHVALEVGPRDLQPFKARLERLNVDHSDIKMRPNGGAVITLRDPDNIQLELFAAPVDPVIDVGRSGPQR